MKTQQANLRFNIKENVMLQTILEIKEDVGSIKSDNTKFKEDFVEVKGLLTKIDSKHNQHYLQWSQEKERLETRIIPLEEDYHKRKGMNNDVKNFGFQSLGKAIWIFVAILLLFIFKDFPNIIDLVKNIL